MIFISSSCVKNSKIADSVQLLAENGFTNIELSGGTLYYDELVADLLALKKKHNLNYLIHNYFPPPKEGFVLNLASLDETVFRQSYEHCVRAIENAKKLGSKAYGVHAGFYINIQVNEIGKNLSKDKLYDREQCINQFSKAFSKLKEIAGNEVELYIENNVISNANYQTFNKVNPLMCTDNSTIEELKKTVDFKLLLDVAHLKVSCQTLSLNFNEQLERLFQQSDYIHISDNDGTKDNNRPLENNSELFQKLTKLDFENKTITLEIYAEIEAIKKSYKLIQTFKNVE